MTAQERAEADKAVKLAVREQREEEAREATRRERRKRKLECRNRGVREGRVGGAAAAFAEGLKGAGQVEEDVESEKENVESGEVDEALEEWAKRLEADDENAYYEGMGELILENPDEDFAATLAVEMPKDAGD